MIHTLSSTRRVIRLRCWNGSIAMTLQISAALSWIQCLDLLLKIVKNVWNCWSNISWLHCINLSGNWRRMVVIWRTWRKPNAITCVTIWIITKWKMREMIQNHYSEWQFGELWRKYWRRRGPDNYQNTVKILVMEGTTQSTAHLVCLKLGDWQRFWFVQLKRSNCCC